jgi:hypothetical protein
LDLYWGKFRGKNIWWLVFFLLTLRHELRGVMLRCSVRN